MRSGGSVVGLPLFLGREEEVRIDVVAPYRSG
jgi:hypothetical protein